MSEDTRAKDAAGTTGNEVRRVLIVDDHPIVRNGLRQLIEHESDLSVCGAAGSAREAMAAIEEAVPDLVLMDITIEGTNGIEVTKDIREKYPELPILVLSMHDENLYAERALRAGARGYAMKQESPETVLTAIRKVLSGGIHVSDTVASRLLGDYVKDNTVEHAQDGLDMLSDRELEIFELIGRGLTTREIADKLTLSIKTVETHRSHIRQKLRAETTASVTHRAVRWVETECQGS